jgi:hypothetical protein
MKNEVFTFIIVIIIIIVISVRFFCVQIGLGGGEPAAQWAPEAAVQESDADYSSAFSADFKNS